jgi:two-component system, chemotaxis family, protein-glutamate methylesterase/glutaminase
LLVVRKSTERSTKMDEQRQKYDLLMIGGSAGSLSMVLKLLPLIRQKNELAIVMIFHRKSTEEGTLIDVLLRKTGFKVKEAEEKDLIEPGTVYVAPADYHVLIERDHTITLDDSEKVNHSRPSIDVSFESAADVYGPTLACLLLSGANADGAAGMLKAKSKGSLILVQDPRTAEVPFMPESAIRTVHVDFIVTAENFLESPLMQS